MHFGFEKICLPSFFEKIFFFFGERICSIWLLAGLVWRRNVFGDSKNVLPWLEYCYVLVAKICYSEFSYAMSLCVDG